MVGRTTRRSRSGRETLPEVRKCRENLPEVRQCQETLSKVRKWLGDHPGGPEVDGRPSRMSGSARETLSVFR